MVQKRPPLHHYWSELVAAILMIFGLILAFFHLYLGGALVGLATGIAFSAEFTVYIAALKLSRAKRGLFKTLMVLGVLLYLLLAAPSFVIGTAIGFAFMSLVRFYQKRRKR